MGTPLDVINANTIDNFAYDAMEAAIDHTPEFGMLEEKGKITEEEGGDRLYQPVEAGEYLATSVGDYADVSANYVPTTLHTAATWNWAQKTVFDALSRGALMRNRGEQALVKFRDRQIPKMLRGLISQGSGSIAYALLNQVSGDTQRTYGLGDIFVFDNVANTETESTITSGATYGGLSLEAGGITGVDNADAYAWTPRGFNTDAAWGGSAGGGLNATKFPNVFAEAQTAITFGNSPELQPDCVLHDRLNFNIGRQYVASIQQIQIDRPDKGDKKWGIGSSVEGFFHNGLMHYWSANMPASSSYVLNFDQIELCYLKPLPLSLGKAPGKTSGDKAKYEDRKSWFTIEVDFNPSRRGLTVEVTADYQFKIQPRFQAKVADFTA